MKKPAPGTLFYCDDHFVLWLEESQLWPGDGIVFWYSRDDSWEVLDGFRPTSIWKVLK